MKIGQQEYIATDTRIMQNGTATLHPMKTPILVLQQTMIEKLQRHLLVAI